MTKKHFKRITALLCAAAIFAGLCVLASAGGTDEKNAKTETPAEKHGLCKCVGGDYECEPISGVVMPSAPGDEVRGNKKASFDVSNAADGYVSVRWLEDTDAKIKVIITGPSGTKYTYNLRNDGEAEVLPLSDGDGEYKLAAYKNVSGSKYSTAYSTKLAVELRDEFAPFLVPNQYVNYTACGTVAAKAYELCGETEETLDCIKLVYDYVVGGFVYDKERAQNVKSGYLPSLEDVLAEKKGICFDYASVMTAMLRSRGIPCKLVVGYAGKVYHAWINVYSEKEGWIDRAIFFDGEDWKLMDPTFASSAGKSDAIMKYIGNGDNYTAKYYY